MIFDYSYVKFKVKSHPFLGLFVHKNNIARSIGGVVVIVVVVVVTLVLVDVVL